ncbi:cyclase family protein [Blastopirellula sp. J2-11]|uniref:cyclase family protein n=1 Tax=Blastopirellula sp. J2-11 TaxID=2943192 RepID=UPI0021CA273A|nr:cyclase family protein [Blastopirellula sp. J2-11]UUO04553.1 cyclase family protein [Blastopirellula sp. J2-11]
MKKLRGLCVGGGYFAKFHLDAWRRIENVEIAALCDIDRPRAEALASEFGIQQTFSTLSQALDAVAVDFVDIVTPPSSHFDLVRDAAARGLPVICQKPLAPDLATSQRIIRTSEEAGIRFMVHENFRFQPWHREIKSLLQAGAIGTQLFGISCRTRMGDGWKADAYLNRQPYFRDMPRFLLQETGVHFIDTFRFLGGEIDEVYCRTRRFNDAIQGEDAAVLSVRFTNGALGNWDANRFHESTSSDPRYTFGAFQIEGDKGSIWLSEEGDITIARLGEAPAAHPYVHERIGFAGDCVRATQKHFADRLISGEEFETTRRDYLNNLYVVEAAYQSAAQNRPIRIDEVKSSAKTGPMIDLTLPINATMPGVDIAACKSIAQDGWNATTLSLYSHSGAHMDAPKHFLPQGASIDQIPLEVMVGPAKVINLAPVAPRELLTLERFSPWMPRIQSGDRLLLRTDWHRLAGTLSYRADLPRISTDLARWLVEKQVALIGVEPPSVADVNNLVELTEVHQILLEGNVVIVEGLANLDQLTQDVVEFIAIPLRVEGGDGCPVRAIAIESRHAPLADEI